MSLKSFSARFVVCSKQRVRLVMVGRETSNKMEGRLPEGCTSVHGNTRMGQTNWR